MRYPLQNGGCGGRWSCGNLNTDICHPIPRDNDDCVYCDKFIYKFSKTKEIIDNIGKERGKTKVENDTP